MLNLIKKEIALCTHPTAFIFLFFAALAFVPNYPYEVIFFFSGLSVFFTCLTSRENGDLEFTCALPVKKECIPLARMAVVIGLQCLLLLLTGIVGAVKQAVFPEEMQLNGAGISANLALVGNGAVLLGLFNIIFFPMYYKNPQKVGVPFLISSAAVFAVICILIVLRYITPLFAETLNGADSVHTAAKLVALALGLCLYAALTALACRLSMKKFSGLDL